VGNRCADHVTPLYPQKLALTSPTGDGRSVGIVRVRTKATEFVLFVCLPPQTPSKSVPCAVGVTRKAQWSHAQCPPKRWPQNAVSGSEQMQHEGLLTAQHGWCGCWKCCMHGKHDLNIASWLWRESLMQQQPPGQQLGIFECTRQSLLHRCWLCIEIGGRTFEHLL